MSKLNDPNFGSMDYDPSRPEEVKKLNDPNFGSNADNFSSKERAAAENARNAERKQEREAAVDALKTGSANAKLSEIAKQGGTVGRRLEREIRRFEQTGRVSGWLAGETLKAESAQNAAQQSAFRQAVTDVISTQYSPLELASPSEFSVLGEKPQLSPQVSGGGGSTRHPFKITSIAQTDDDGNLTGSYIVKINIGTINNVLPSNWDIEQTIDGSTLYYVILSVNAAAQRITSATFSISGSPPSGDPVPVKWSLPSTFQVLIGMVKESQVFQSVFNNLSFTGSKRLTTDRANPQIGQLPYDNWYTWQRVG